VRTELQKKKKKKNKKREEKKKGKDRKIEWEGVGT
jgi:hypothetical protein